MLKTPPTPETIEKINQNADKLLELSEKKFGFALDYSEEALVIGDDLITIFFKLHRSHFYTAAIMIGAYLGNLIIKNLGGKWREDLAVRKVGRTKALINPVIKAKKRLENGLTDSLVFYYQNLKLTTTGDTEFAKDKTKLANWREQLRAGGWHRVLLERMLNKKEKRYVREEAADLLCRLGDNSLIPALLKALNKQETAYYAAIALQGLPDSNAFNPLLKLLKSSRSNSVRIQAALALGVLKDERAVPILAELLNHRNEIICHYAAIALGKIGGEKALEVALEILGGSQQGKPIYAITALEGIKDQRAVPALIEALFSPQEEVREAAARALQFIPDQRAAQPLLNLLKEASPRLRILSAYALAHLGNHDFITQIRELLKDPTALVREHADRVLYWMENQITPAKCI